MTAPILITGFQPFGMPQPDHPWAADHTASLLDRLAGEPGVVTAALPPLYDACGDVFAELLARHRPKAALGFAYLEASDSIQLERLAWNRDESPLPDDAGTVRAGTVGEEGAIVPGGPTAHGSTLPVPRVMRELAMAGLPVTFGDFSGFLGNHLFYRARHVIETGDMDVPYGFFHLPATTARAKALRGRGGLAPERQELALRTLVGMLKAALDGVA